jgi:DNA-binding transcriptional ArsR family regulator
MFNLLVERSSPTLDTTYAALAHDVRRTLLARLRTSDARVTELAEPFDLSLNAISKHIRVLERAGLARRTVHGRDHWLALESAPMREAADWIEAYRAFWEGRIDALERLLEEDR